MIRNPVKIIDRPLRPNLANYESRLRRMRNEIAAILADIDEALERIDKDRKASS
jgi:predicted  nucleic acid-binding Zn-ribbon protein